MILFKAALTTIALMLPLSLSQAAEDKSTDAKAPATKAGKASAPQRQPLSLELPEERISLRLNRPEGREEITLAFAKDRLIWVSNTTGLVEQNKKLLGVLERPLDKEAWLLQREVQRLEQRYQRRYGQRQERSKSESGASSGSAPSHHSHSPHQPWFQMGQVSLSPEDPFHEDLVDILERASGLGGWSAVDAISLQLRGRQWQILHQRSGQAPTRSALDPKNCQPFRSQLQRCVIPGYGTAYL